MVVTTAVQLVWSVEKTVERKAEPWAYQKVLQMVGRLVLWAWKKVAAKVEQWA
jgi:hypothetical protein